MIIHADGPGRCRKAVTPNKHLTSPQSRITFQELTTMAAMQISRCLLAVAIFAQPVNLRADDGEEKAIQTVQAWGGMVVRDEKAPGKPVIEVQINQRDISDADLGELARFSQLKMLSVTLESKVTGAGLKKLAGLQHLQKVDLWNSEVTDEGLKGVGSLKHLRSLSLQATQITGSGMKELVGLEELRELNLGVTQITSDGLKKIAGLKRLESLSLWHARDVNDDSLKSLAGSSKLRTLVLDGTGVTDQGMNNLKSWKQLESLSLHRTAISDKGVRCLGSVGKAC